MSGWFRGLDSNLATPNVLFESADGDRQVTINGNTNDLGGVRAGTGFLDSGVDLLPANSANRWQHIAAVGSGGQTKYYIDGKLVGSVNQQFSANVLEIGNGNRGGTSFRFAEQIDEIALFNRALNDDQIATLFTTFAPGLVTDNNAYGVHGDLENEQLSRLMPVGDFNGDSQNDFMAVGSSFSYLLFGPVVHEDFESVREAANIIIDHNALGKPAERMGDINGDGLSDLVFLQDTGVLKNVNMVFGGRKGGFQAGSVAPWPRNWDADFATSFLVPTGPGANYRRISLTASAELSSNGLKAQVFETTGDTMDDVIITSAKDNNFSGFGAIGYIYSGKTITNFSGTELGLSNRLGSIENNGPGSINVESRVVGDVNGDGLDDVLFGNVGNFVSILGVGSTGTPFLSGLIEELAPNNNVSINSLFGERRHPFAIGDANRDGFDDFALSGPNDLQVFYGGPNLVNVMVPDLTIFGSNLSVTGEISMAMDLGILQFPAAILRARLC